MVRYRKAKKNDLLQIAAIDRLVWIDNKSSEFIPDGEHVWRHWIDGAIVICAYINTEIIGAAVAFPCIGNIFCVHKLFVQKDYRGKKIGTTLFEHILKKIDIHKMDAYLTVDPENSVALKLYESHGFSEKKFIQGYYRKNEDRFILTRRYKKK